MEKPQISKRIREIAKAQGLNISQLADKSKIDKGSMYRLINGQRKWTLPNITKVAVALNVAPAELLTEGVIKPKIVAVPVIASITDGAFPEALLDLKPPAKGTEVVYMPWMGGQGYMMQKCYAVKIVDDSLLPTFRRGTILVAQADTWNTIIPGDYVIFPQGGAARVCQILTDPENPESIILADMGGERQAHAIMARYLRVLDKIIDIKFA